MLNFRKLKPMKKKVFWTFHILNSWRNCYGMGTETLWLSWGGGKKYQSPQKKNGEENFYSAEVFFHQLKSFPSTHLDYRS